MGQNDATILQITYWTGKWKPSGCVVTPDMDTDPDFVQDEPKDLYCGIQIRGLSSTCDSASDVYRKPTLAISVTSVSGS